MIRTNDEIEATISLISPVGVVVDLGGTEGFIDLRKHPSWWGEASPPQIGDQLLGVVLDDSRTPPRLSALREDIEIARRVRTEDS